MADSSPSGPVLPDADAGGLQPAHLERACSTRARASLAEDRGPADARPLHAVPRVAAQYPDLTPVARGPRPPPALFGVDLGCSFAPSHKGMPVLTPGETAAPLLRQVLSSRNLHRERFLGLALDGLNLHIEHHMCPSMPRPKLRRAQPIIRRHCQVRGISYTEATLLCSYAMAMRHLHRVCAALRATDDAPQP